ncbi:conserved hypothetical protein [Candida albicans WO-1]|uniref:Uncharacterized protein n=2 Tax=Candida albicans TaxID=5476 RepID=Q5ACW4_CANAL|nr:uncharacterized protein CAALFM_C200310WA [Candida albicans SC5314]AOW27085.1 hypothetical protein CAALFM_C200310WA [Candida albicans SC5314]EEQ45482.1 conserved hypothetical protein [Candida albicans WO-1]|eukprot:XP_719549.1 hypothetical protein CAALFM_C200310WA [Candida albicans SC5314]
MHHQYSNTSNWKVYRYHYSKDKTISPFLVPAHQSTQQELNAYRHKNILDKSQSRFSQTWMPWQLDLVWRLCIWHGLNHIIISQNVPITLCLAISMHFVYLYHSVNHCYCWYWWLYCQCYDLSPFQLGNPILCIMLLYNKVLAETIQLD